MEEEEQGVEPQGRQIIRDIQRRNCQKFRHYASDNRVKPSEQGE